MCCGYSAAEMHTCREGGAGGASAKGVTQLHIIFIVSVPGSLIL